MKGTPCTMELEYRACKVTWRDENETGVVSCLVCPLVDRRGSAGYLRTPGILTVVQVEAPVTADGLLLMMMV